MTTPDPAHLRSRHDCAVRGGNHAGKPILYIGAQRIVGSEFRDLRSFGTPITVPLGGRGPVLGVAATCGGVAAQLARDRRRRSTQPRGDLADAETAGEADGDLLTLDEGQVARGSPRDDGGHPRTRAEPPR